MTARFLTPLILEDHGGLPFVLHAPLSYVTAADELITVPARFATDLASIPRPLWAVLPPVGKYDRAGVLHDHAYQTGAINGRVITRHDADALMLEAMTVLRVGRVARYAIWTALRVAGGIVWRRYRAASTNGAVVGSRTAPLE
jgi:hypothetical protein